MTKQEAYRRIAEYEAGRQRRAKQRRAQQIVAERIPIILVGGRLAHHRRPPQMELPLRTSPQLAARIRQREKDRTAAERLLVEHLLPALVPLRPSRRGAKRKVTLPMLVDYIFDHPTHRLWKITKGLGAQIGGPTTLSRTTVKPLLKVLRQLSIYSPPKPRRPSAPPKTSRQRP